MIKRELQLRKKKEFWWITFLQTHILLLRYKMVLEWIHVDYLWIIVMFSSAVWTLIPTAPIHCRGSIGNDVLPNVSKSGGLTSKSWNDATKHFWTCLIHPDFMVIRSNFTRWLIRMNSYDLTTNSNEFC